MIQAFVSLKPQQPPRTESGIRNFFEDLQGAVALAKEITPSGKSCILSPAAASYGYFKNFEERGEVFQQLIKG